MKAFRLLLAVVLLVPIVAGADENPRRTPEQRAAAGGRHFIVQTRHALRPAEKSELEARGVDIQHVLPNNRYLVRAADVQQIESDPRVESIVPYGASHKIARSALREAVTGRAFARVRLLFHDDVSFDDARAAIEEAGGSIDRPLSVDFDSPHRLVALIPSTALETLASDERVFGIYGPPLHPAVHNSDAALLSNVTPLYSAPYGLTGQGVVLSEFEFSAADVAHPEFQGRLTVDANFSDTSEAAHGTHVAGTMIAAGIDPRAKGMAPGATLHEFNANSDTLTTDKQNLLPPLGIVADNNSWGFHFGWQFDGTAPGNLVWLDSIELFGGYDAFFSAPYDKIAHGGPVLFVHSAGNDGDGGHPPLDTVNFSPHAHVDDTTGVVIKGETFCYSKNGSGTDCPTPFCTAPLLTHCERTPHPTYGPYTTIGLTGSLKNVLVVGAVSQSGVIASFSSRGPTVDGRVKPDVVAMGLQQYSTITNGGYEFLSGTSMSSPVVTGICALLTEQWRRTYAGQNPTPEVLKTLLIAGADDLGNPGPDYTYGFGLADAKASVDLVIADDGHGSRIRTGSVAQGQQIDFPIRVTSTQNLRVVLGWADPEALLPPATDTNDPLADKTLVNDLDLKIIDPNGITIFPYVLDKNNPAASASRGVNNTDTTEEVELKNAGSGTYHAVVTGTAIGDVNNPSQFFVLISNGTVGNPSPPCGDLFEPNDTEAAAYKYLVSGLTITASTCSPTDLDYYAVRVDRPGPLTVSVTATDTPIRLTLSGNGITPIVANIAAGATGSTSTEVSNPPAMYLIKVEPTGPIGSNAAYALTPTYSFSIPARRRTSRH